MNRIRHIGAAVATLAGALLALAAAVPVPGGGSSGSAVPAAGGSFSMSWYDLSPAAASPSICARKPGWPPSTPGCPIRRCSFSATSRAASCGKR
jgi:hypothetical protein